MTSGLLVGTLLLTTITVAGRMDGSLLSGTSWIVAHEVLGFGGVLIAAPLVLDSGPFAAMAWVRLLMSAVFWMFVSGGVLDRLARNRPTRTAAFFSASGVHWFRFLRLDALMAVFPWLLLWWTGSYLGQSVVVSSAVVLALMIWSMIGDYAKVRIVVEDRHSAIGALAGAIRFIARHPLQTFALYLLNAGVILATLVFWPRYVISESTISRDLLFATVALTLQILARLSFMASSVVLFQSKLAHAGYVAAPLPMWPDSPSAEGLQNLIDRR